MKPQPTQLYISKLKSFNKHKAHLSEDGKRKLLRAFQLVKEIQSPKTLDEDEDFAQKNVIAKTFDTKSDFDSYVKQHRGIEMTPRELQTIANYKLATPTQRDKFFVKYESTDDFGTNSTTVIKKLKEGNQFCWTAFSKYESAEGDEESEPVQTADQPQPNPAEEPEVVVDDQIRITKSITFTDDTDGSNILGSFLIKLEL